jgi:hypothetical protein
MISLLNCKDKKFVDNPIFFLFLQQTTGDSAHETSSFPLIGPYRSLL